MKKIFFFFALLPFSVFAELYPEDLNYISGRLDAIFTSSSKIENDVDEIVNYTSLLSGRCYQIIQGQDATRTQVIEIKSRLTDLNYLVESLKASINTYLPSLDTNLHNAVTALGYCQNYLYDIKNTISNIYDELSKLGTIADDLASIKFFLEDKCAVILAALTDINTVTENIYDELLSQGYDIKEISDIVKNIFVTPLTIFEFKTRYWTYSGASNIGSPSTLSQYVISEYRNTSSNFFNYVSRVLSKSYDLQGVTQHTLDNFSFRIYDIQTNFYSSIKIQKDISTNVAYIASVITNSHDLLKLIASNVVKIAHHTMPTNVAEQYETQQDEQIEQISSSYQDHENDMSSYESSLTHLPARVQNRFDDNLNYISRLSSSNFSVDRLGDEIFSSLPDYHSTLANMSFSLPITTKLTPDFKQIFAIIRKCVTTTIWVFTFLFTLFMIQKFLQFVGWIMSLLQPATRDVFGNVSNGPLYRLMGG